VSQSEIAPPLRASWQTSEQAAQHRRLSFTVLEHDSEPSPKPSLEQLAAEAGVNYWDARAWLEREVDQRRQEQYRMRGHATKRLDVRLQRLTGKTDQTLK
jgi:hypothetical protein